MLQFLGRALLGLFAILKVAAMVAMVGLGVVVLSNAAMLESRYFAKYENSFQRVEREHQRNLAVGEMIQSQMAWERTSEGLRQAYSDERANRVRAQRQLEIREYEFYAFLKVLEKKYPGATVEVLEELAPGPVIREPKKERSILVVPKDKEA